MPEYLRLIGATYLQTPIRGYHHRETGRRITVVCTMHMGVAAYFTGLRAVIDKLQADGAVVQSEGSRMLDSTADTTADELLLLTGLRHATEIEDQRAAVLGWVTQAAGLAYPADGMSYPPDWQIVDLSHLEIIRRVGVDTMRRHLAGRNRLFGQAVNRRGARYLLMITIGMRIGANDRLNHMAEDHRKQQRREDPMNAVLLGERNAVALAGLDRTDLDTVLIWGAKHLPGLHAGLTERGYERVPEPEQWHTVTTLPSVRRALWQVITGRPATFGSEPITAPEPAGSSDTVRAGEHGIQPPQEFVNR